MRRLLSIGVGALAMIASIATAVPARAGTIDVLPGESIHAAVKAAQPGDTIQLHPGVYEDVVVIKKDDITIQGAGSGEDGTILHPPADPARSVLRRDRRHLRARRRAAPGWRSTASR